MLWQAAAPAPTTFSTSWPVATAVILVMGIVASVIMARARTQGLAASARAAEARATTIRLSEERFRRLFDASTDAQLIVDGEHVISANPAATALFGMPDGALPGVRIAALIDGATVRAGEDDLLFESMALASDGERIPVSVRRMLIPLDVTMLTHFDIRDLRQTRRLANERRELEAQLLASQRLEALGTLAGGVAHDFNNLLTVIRSNAEIAQISEQEGDDEGVRESLAAVVDASDRARDIVKQILLFSRRSAPSRVRLNLAALITDTQTLLRATIPTTVQLLLEVRDGHTWIKGDTTQMQQLLLNLCSNAEHAMRSTGGGILRLTVDTVDLRSDPDVATRHPGLPALRYVRLRVRDTGVGMSEDIRERIFEPFFTTKPVGEGTGLGMAVLHGIVMSHGGSVHVESQEGAGTMFELLFAQTTAPAEGATVLVPTPLVLPVLTGVRHRTPTGDTAPLILLVDDEPTVLRAAEKSIASLGLRVLTADSGAAALELLRLHPDIALLITDQTMPGMTGTALAELVHAQYPSVPIILSTGYIGRVSPARMREARIAHVLDKPYTLTQLTTAIDAALHLPNRAVSTLPALAE
jgi:two-component system, cell cycle sensor histidine kinase and response regulator CckA